MLLLVNRVVVLLSFGLSRFFSSAAGTMSENVTNRSFPIVFLLLSLVIAPSVWSPAFVARPENVGVGLLTNKCFMELYIV